MAHITIKIFAFLLHYKQAKMCKDMQHSVAKTVSAKTTDYGHSMKAKIKDI